MKTLRSKFMRKWAVLIAINLLFSCTYEQATKAQVPTSSNEGKKIKIALLLDTSNSMDGLIEQAKSQLWSIVNELAKARCDNTRPSLQIALYEYGNSSLASRVGYIRQVSPFTDDLDDISEDLFSLTTNGGDEYCGYVIQTALNQLEWSPDGDDLQLVFIAGNEPFTQGNVDYVKACTNAKNKKVVVNTIFCGNIDEGVDGSWKRGADIAKGSYMSIEQNKKTVYIETPYDEKIIDLNTRLNDTYIPYGRKGIEKKQKQEKQDSNAETYGTTNSFKRTVSKSSHMYKNTSWDLVDAAEEKEFNIELLEEKELPAEMQNMNTIEKQKYIEKKNTQRVQVKKEISILNKQRLEYIAKDKKLNSEDENMLDKAMLAAVRKQAELLKFTFNSNQ